MIARLVFTLCSVLVALAVVNLVAFELEMKGEFAGILFRVGGSLGVWIIVYLLCLLGFWLNYQRNK